MLAVLFLIPMYGANSPVVATAKALTPTFLPLKQTTPSQIDVSNGFVAVWNEERTQTILVVPIHRVLLIRSEPEE